MTAKRDVNMESQLPQGMAGEKLRDLERGPITQRIQEDVPAQAPHFVTQIAEVAIEEGENVHFECRVEPKNDTNLRVDWYHNGKLLPNGHRFRTMFELGFVSLDILYAYPEDAGEYLCRAYNAIGEDKTKAVLTCKSILRHVRTERWKMINFLCFFFSFFPFFFRIISQASRQSSCRTKCHEAWRNLKRCFKWRRPSRSTRPRFSSPKRISTTAIRDSHLGKFNRTKYQSDSTQQLVLTLCSILAGS